MARDPKTNATLSDRDLDSLLALASKPELPAGAANKLLQRLGPKPMIANVLPFPAPAKKSGRLSWLVGLPLAASLAAGIWLGAMGQGTDYVFSMTDELASLGDGLNVSTGIDDAEDLTEEEVS